jgi:hypothetical protein
MELWRGTRMWRVLGVAAAALGIASSTASAAYDPSDPAQLAQYNRALSLGIQAYEYGVPLLDTNRIFATSTSVNVCNPLLLDGPVNQLCRAKRLAQPKNRVVVAPNHDTLYTQGWLDLTGGPMVLGVPRTPGHFHVFELVDAYTTNFANISSQLAGLYPNPRQRPYAHPDGYYIIAAPHTKARHTLGLPVIYAPTTRVWVIGRTLVKSSRDVQTVDKLERLYSLTPLSKFKPGQTWTPPAPKHPHTTQKIATIPGTATGSNPLAFFDALGAQLALFPPPPADKPLRGELATVGIGPGMQPSATQDAATLAGLSAAVPAGEAAVTAEIRTLYLRGFKAHNGWLVGDLGTYGTNYAVRAAVDKLGVGALDGRVATYPLAEVDDTLGPLTGAKRYVAYFAPGTVPPPVTEFWSLTLYDKNQFLVPNPAGRYLLNDRTPLHRNSDGSLYVYIQPEAPTNLAQYGNWLPSPGTSDPGDPTQGFDLVMRLYGIKPSAFGGVQSGAGWRPPLLLPCDATGHTSTGIACAS